MNLTQARIMMQRLVIEHGLSPKWETEFDNAKRRFGCCHIDTKTITISKYLAYLNSEEEVRNTILHEIAHALAYEHHLHRGHGPEWKRIAREIGCTAERCHNAETVPGKFVYECPGCKKEARYHKRLQRERACRACCVAQNNGRFDRRFVFRPKWHRSFRLRPGGEQ